MKIEVQLFLSPTTNLYTLGLRVKTDNEIERPHDVLVNLAKDVLGSIAMLMMPNQAFELPGVDAKATEEAIKEYIEWEAKVAAEEAAKADAKSAEENGDVLPDSGESA